MRQDSMMTGFVADAVIEHIRSGNVPTDGDATFLDRRPLIDTLREKVSREDIPLLLQILEEGSGPAAGLAVSLLRKHIDIQEVKNRFADRWATANPYLKNRLMWRMLDDPTLPQTWHRRFFDFVLEEWQTFRDFNLKFYGDGKEGINNLLSRVGDPSFPDSKKWIYLCCAPDVIEDRNAAKAFVSLGVLMSDPFTREVAEVLLKRFFSTQ